MTPHLQSTGHCKNEGRCIEFAFAPLEWRKDDICLLCGCDGDTRNSSQQNGRDELLDDIISLFRTVINKFPNNSIDPKLRKKLFKILEELRSKGDEQG